MVQFVLTEHAIERAKERAGWSRAALWRMLERVYYDGLSASAPARRIRQFLAAFQESNPSRVARTYGEHVFIFARGDHPNETILVTVLSLPHELRSAAREARRPAHETVS